MPEGEGEREGKEKRGDEERQTVARGGNSLMRIVVLMPSLQYEYHAITHKENWQLCPRGIGHLLQISTLIK